MHTVVLHRLGGIDEKRYSILIDDVLVNMQKDGYDIVDIKFTSEGQLTSYDLLIMYK